MTGQFQDMKERATMGEQVEREQGARRKASQKLHKRRLLPFRQGGNTHGHVIACASEGSGHRSDQFARHSEIAKFDNSFTGQEDV